MAFPQMLNAMSIDVEDYFHVSAFETTVPRQRWGDLESRVCANTERLLEIFAASDVRATFFVLGWVAERFPGLIRQLIRGGHEVASHGYEHRLVYSMSREEFRRDLRKARDVLESAGSAPVQGYRAPSYSITRDSLWALDVLIEEGYVYDASIYPIRHDRYGIHDWPREMMLVQRAAGSLWEVPGSTVRCAGLNLPFGGGGYFRIFPYAWTQRGVRALNELEARPAVFYLHPWEIDPDQPKLPGSLLSRLRHYRNLHVTETRLRRLLSEFRFVPIREVLEKPAAAPALVHGGAPAAIGDLPPA